jgi:hypothetical protein
VAATVAEALTERDELTDVAQRALVDADINASPSTTA